MKLLIENGKVACTLEGKNGKFLHDCYLIFDGYINGKLRMREGNVESEYKRLDALISHAERNGIEIAEEVRVRLKELKGQYEENELKRIEAEEQAKKEQEWKNLKENGCKGCKNCFRVYQGEDDYICEATKEELAIGNRPTYDYINHVYRLFNYVPFPTDKCPFNTERRAE